VCQTLTHDPLYLILTHPLEDGAWRECGRERGREGGKEGGREGGKRDEGREGGRQGGREVGRDLQLGDARVDEIVLVDLRGIIGSIFPFLLTLFILACWFTAGADLDTERRDVLHHS